MKGMEEGRIPVRVTHNDTKQIGSVDVSVSVLAYVDDASFHCKLTRFRVCGTSPATTSTSPLSTQRNSQKSWDSPEKECVKCYL